MRDDEGLPRPLVTLEGAAVECHPVDVLGSDAAPRRSAGDVLRAVLSWEPRRDLLVPLTAAASVLLLAGAASAVALELRPASTLPADVLAATVDAGTFRVDLTSEVLGAGAPVDRGGAAVVVVDLERDAFRFEVETIGAGGERVTFTIVTIGRDTWTRPPQAEELARAALGGEAEPAGEPLWFRSDTSDDGAQVLGTEAGLRELLGDARVVRPLSDDEVDGDEVQRVLLAIPRPGSEQPDVDGSDGLAAETGGEVEAELSVDADGRLRRLVVDDDDDGSVVRSTVLLSRFGQDVRIDPPPADLVREGGDGFFTS